MPGLDNTIVNSIDFSIIGEHIKSDIKSDFIIAPHLNISYVSGYNETCSRLVDKLSSGTYSPELPVTLSVPKGRGFTRPGSILLPNERIVYQLLIDSTIDRLEEQLNRERSFSHVPSTKDGVMFTPSHDCWNQYQAKTASLCANSSYTVKADIANYFERLPQHHLINLMSSAGCSGSVVNLLEKMLLAFQAQNSFGIIQGVYSSDVLGNYFLSELDAYCELKAIDSTRYVDDIFMFFDTEKEANKGLFNLIEMLRSEGLHLNEYKSGVFSSQSILQEENEIDDLFEDARKEAENELTEYVQTSYGFTVEWDIIDEPNEVELELKATELLYDAKDNYEHQSDKIDKFCLPLMRTIGSDYAVEDVLRNLDKKEHLTKLYHSYLSKFVSGGGEIVAHLESTINGDEQLTDYQKMYTLASLQDSNSVTTATCNTVLNWLHEHAIAKETRALSAIFVAKHGNPNQRRAVRLSYDSEPSDYVRAAILYSSKYFVTAERRTCKRAWGGHNELNSIIANSV